jgi:hypothetical protein
MSWDAFVQYGELMREEEFRSRWEAAGAYTAQMCGTSFTKLLDQCGQIREIANSTAVKSQAETMRDLVRILTEYRITARECGLREDVIFYTLQQAVKDSSSAPYGWDTVTA